MIFMHKYFLLVSFKQQSNKTFRNISMETGVNLFLVLTLCTTLCSCQWESPYFEDPGTEGVSITESEGPFTTINMEEEIEGDVLIGIINYYGETEPSIAFSEPNNQANNYLGARFERFEDGWKMLTTIQQDYESTILGGSRRYVFTVTIGTVERRVILNIVNINDNNPAILTENTICNIPENSMETPNCFYTISDVDGWLNEVGWTLSDHSEVFAFSEEKRPTSDTATTMETNIYNLNELDFEETQMYLLNWTILDTETNTQQTTSMRIVIQVEDVADTPPTWRNIFASQEFDEKEAQTFEVEAIDGDIGINDPIFYFITNTDWKVNITIEDGTVHVDPIDRDFHNEQIYTFTINACEVPDPNSCILQNVTFIVNDINDNAPEISADERDFIIDENQSSLDIRVTIKDADLGDNAMYSVTLENDNSSTQINDAFSVVPSRGYQETEVFIYIKNATLLDYENEEWRSFEFQLVAQEDMNVTHRNVVTFTIELTNLNDEIPIFEENNYTIEINETIGIDEFIEKVYAEDRDVDDTVVHELLGTAILQRLKINEITGEIRTIVDRAFDYEVQSEVIVQIQASDTLFGGEHTAVAQLSIKVLDENDETPRIAVASGRIELDENREDDYLIDVSNITATDEDTDAKLTFTIDWDLSYATKSGQRITEENFINYKECVLVETVELETVGEGAYVAAKLTISDVVPENTPDYELFDVLYISLTVTDDMQTYGVETDTVIVPIYVNDINDVAPVFDENSIDSNKSVNEHSDLDTLISVITATDEDGPNITYKLIPLEGTPQGWVTINERGELRVSSEDIDADDPIIWSLFYEVVASDGYHNTTEEIEIAVIDVNDNVPKFVIILEQVDIDEKSDSGTQVQTIHAEDADRDPQNNVVTYYFNEALTEITPYFSINRENGEITVEYEDENNKLDRDNGIPAIDITIIVHARDGGNLRSEDKSFTVTLQDINDKNPIIQTSQLIASEQYTEGTIIGEITAIDNDEAETDNSKIHFTINDIKKGSDANKDPPAEPMFVLTVTETFSPAVASLQTNIDLRDYHGTYIVNVTTEDFGTRSRNDIKDIEVIVEKYNFVPPTFINPTNGQLIYLLKTQTVGNQLFQYDGTPLEDFEATDNQGEKWEISFFTDDDDTFRILPFGRNGGRLTLQTDDYDINKEYELEITAQDNGTPEQYSSIVSIVVKFVDVTAEPVFIELENSINFKENQTVEQSEEFSIAKYEGTGNELGFPVYYFIRTDPTPFTINVNNKNRLYLSTLLDREENCCYTLEIVASQKNSGNINPEDGSILKLNVELDDINDNPPNFETKSYYSTVMSTYTFSTTVLTVLATDLDADPILTYSIDRDSFESTGTNIDNIPEPFTVDATSGIITLQNLITSSMDGFFKFDVVVYDTLFTDTATVQVYIVTETHRVDYIFENDLDSVTNKKTEIINILDGQFGFKCNIETIERDSNDNGEPLDQQTVARVHCIDSETNEPVPSYVITSQMNDLEVYSALRLAFLAESLILSYSNTVTTTDNTVEVLKGWLIGVSIVLGTLCAVLLIAFVLKVRSLTTRLNKLIVNKWGSQESGLNRKAAPTTNKHAIEGTNPAFNEVKKPPEFDETSIGSADSDLVGVENNPEFQYGYEKTNNVH